MYCSGFCKYFTKIFVYFLKIKKWDAEASHPYIIFPPFGLLGTHLALRLPCSAPRNGPHCCTQMQKLKRFGGASLNCACRLRAMRLGTMLRSRS